MPDYTPTVDEVRDAFALIKAPGTYGPGLRRAFDRWLAAWDRENRAIGWDEALEHVWKLNDPAYTVITDTESIHPVVTEADVYQAKRENPYRE